MNLFEVCAMNVKRARLGLAASVIGLVAVACSDTPGEKTTSGPAGTGGGSGTGTTLATGSGTGTGSGTMSGGSTTTSAGSGPATGSAGSAASTTGGGSGGGGGAGPTGGTGGATGGGSAGSGGTGAGGKADAGPGGSGGTGGTSVDGGGGTTCPATGLAGAGQVRIVKNGTTFSMTRDGVPYYVKGIDGAANLDLAQRSGVNSLRTFDSTGAQALLDNAASHCMTVSLGVSLSNMPGDFTNETFKAAKRAEVTNLLATIKNHPALLTWVVGNEIQLSPNNVNDNATTVGFVQELTQTIHQQDTNHPVITAVAGANATFINHLVQWAPALDALGINSYGGVGSVVGALGSTSYMGAILITEWGPTGWWEAAQNTSWGRPVEETSGEKGRVYQTRYVSFAHKPRVLGDYVFLWGQKIENTPTWFGMFLETITELGIAGESLPTVDTMVFNWLGAYPANRAPDVTGFTLGGRAAGGNVALTAGQTVPAVVTVTEPDGDTMSYVWEILQDPTVAASNMGETRKTRVGNPQKGTAPMFNVTAPPAGQYRLFVYVLDGKGHAGTANIPFRVN
jgi:hypothetical protein